MHYLLNVTHCPCNAENSYSDKIFFIPIKRFVITMNTSGYQWQRTALCPNFCCMLQSDRHVVGLKDPKNDAKNTLFTDLTYIA